MAYALGLGLLAVAAGADAAPIVSQSFEGSGATSSGATTSTTAGSATPELKRLPDGWRLSAFLPEAASAVVETAQPTLPAADGTHFLRINTTQKNHARVIFDVAIAPDTSYHFHAEARASGTDLTLPSGGVLGVDGQFTISSPTVPDGQWHALDLYVHAGKQTKITLTLGVGNFGQLNTGTADFDAVTVTPVTSVPAGAKVMDFDPKAQGVKKTSSVKLPVGPNKFLFVLAGMLAVGAVVVGVYITLTPESTVTAEEIVTTPVADAGAEADTGAETDADADVTNAEQPHG